MRRNSLGLCQQSQMHTMIQKLIVRWWYQSLSSCCWWTLNINHKLCMLRLILCSHCDLRVNVLFFRLYLRTDESMLGLASLSAQTKSIFHTRSVLAISCSLSEVKFALEVSTPSILFVFFILASVQPTKAGSEVCLIDISFFSTARKLYRKDTVKWVDMQVCSHWCLPSAPPVWYWTFTPVSMCHFMY